MCSSRESVLGNFLLLFFDHTARHTFDVGESNGNATLATGRPTT